MTYKKVRLGDYLLGYDEINKNGEFSDLEDLQGINSEKYFQGCKSNKNDIELNRYRICRQGMFAYNKATSRNGEKISIAYRREKDCLISPSYICFSIKDESLLMPEYLMLWFKRPVFDRYARYNSWGSATEFFTWEDFQEIEFNLPTIDEQKKIVNQHRIITERIKVLENINEKLDNLLVVKFNQLFEELHKQEPTEPLEKYILFGNGKSRPASDGDLPVYGGNGIMSYTNKTNAENVVIIGRVGAYCGSVFMEEDKCWVSDNAIYGKSKMSDREYFDYVLLRKIDPSKHREGTGQPLVTQKIMNALLVNNYDIDNIEIFNDFAKSICSVIKENTVELSKLYKLVEIITQRIG